MSFKDDVRVLSKRIGKPYSFVHAKLTGMQTKIEALALQKGWTTTAIREAVVEYDFNLDPVAASDVLAKAICADCTMLYPMGFTRTPGSGLAPIAVPPLRCAPCTRKGGAPDVDL
jgi:hypothetical protein